MPDSGTSFPGSPHNGDLFYRTDLKTEFKDETQPMPTKEGP